MTVALEVLSALVLDDGPYGRRGAKRRRAKDEEEEELKGLKAVEEASDQKKLKLAYIPRDALRYQLGKQFHAVSDNN